MSMCMHVCACVCMPVGVSIGILCACAGMCAHWWLPSNQSFYRQFGGYVKGMKSLTVHYNCRKSICLSELHGLYSTYGG